MSSNPYSSPSSLSDPIAPGTVPNHLVWAIVSTVLATCLCCPLGLVGIVAIVFSSKVNSLLRVGDLAGAQQASAKAKTWCWVATVLAIIGLVWSVYAVFSGQSQLQYEQFMQILEQAQSQ